MRAAPLLLALIATRAIAAPASPVGIWRNAADSVRIRVAPCGRGLCGTVVRASARAEADAAAGGTERLVGAQLFRDFRPGAEDMWEGSVFVPDLGREVAGTLEQQSASTLIVRGCLFAGIGCKSQTWVRVR